MSYRQYQEYSGNPYTNAPATEDGYGDGAGVQNHLAEPTLDHEMSSHSNPSQYSATAAPAGSAGGAPLSQGAFLKEVDEVKTKIRSLGESIGQIGTLHQRALSSPDSSTSNQLEGLVTETQTKNHEIKESIKFLERDAAKDASSNVKHTQVKQLKRDFESQLKLFQTEEINYKKAYQEAQKRQWMIVNPDATETELQEVAEMDWGTEGVFQTALKSNRSGQVSTTLGNVRARHNEIQKIEKTLTELASMFADMAQLVEAQEPVVQHTEENAIKTQEDVDRGNSEIAIATKHARNRNKLKWWCLLVTVLIVLAIALGVGLGIGLANRATKI